MHSVKSVVAANDYEPPCSPARTLMIRGREPLLAPGVRGYAFRVRDRIEIPIIIAEHEGSGDVGRFLDSLSPRCVIPCVISYRLIYMLARRGWAPNFEPDEDGGEIDVWVRTWR
ncbi:MAG TPA: hypothetical protein VH439_17125 [Gemmatimonadales bacterium]|jgi:hypothetical protein